LAPRLRSSDAPRGGSRGRTESRLGAAGFVLAAAWALPVAGFAQSAPDAGPELLRPALPLQDEIRPSPVGMKKKPLSNLKSTQSRPVVGVPAPVPLVPASTPAGLGTIPSTKPAPPLPPIAVPARRRGKAEDDPWAPLGTEAFGMILRPSIAVDAGHDSNPNRVSGPHKGSSVVAPTATLDVRSDWVRHAFAADWRGTLFRYPGEPSANRPESDGRAALRLDVLRDTSVEIAASEAITTQRPGSVEQPAVGSKRSLIETLGGSIGLEQRFGDAALALKGSLGRSVYDDIVFSDGSVQSQADRDYDTRGVSLRASYEISPGVKPFVQASLDERRYDQRIDAGGYERSSRGLAGTVGSSFELTRMLTGEVSGGYAARNYEDPRLAALRGAILDASLVWTATPLTTVRLKAATSLEETSVANASGAVVQTAGLEIEHALRRNLVLAGSVLFTRTQYQGASIREDGISYGLKLDYKLTRSVVLRASALQERLHSTVQGSDYTANVFLVGLRLQH
jgi:hypothetical protein